MKKFMKRFNVLMLAMIMAATMSACTAAAPSDEPTETGFSPKCDTETEARISVMGSYANFESLEAEFERFGAYYPNVEMEYVALDDYDNTISSALAGAEPPDIYVMNSWMEGKKRHELLFESAENLADPQLEINLSCIRPDNFINSDSDNIIMMPIFTSSYGMLVNEKLFEENDLAIPTNYEELLYVCEKLREAGYESPVMGANVDEASGIYYPMSFPMFCKNVMENQDRIEQLRNLEPDAADIMRPALERMKEFIDTGYIDIEKCTAEITDGYNEVIMRFFEGDVPMMLGSGDTVSGTRKRESKSDAFTANPFEYSFHVFPIGDDGGYFLNAPTIYFAVNKNSANLDMANEFMRFLTSSGELENMAEIKRIITPTNNFSFDKVYSSLADIPADRAFNYTETNINDEITTAFKKAAYNVANGIMTIDEALENYDTFAP